MRASRTVVPPTLRSPLAAALVAATTAVLAGCQPPPKPMPAPAPPPPVPTETQVMAMQQQMASIDPKAHVGHVAGVKADIHLAAVLGFPADVKVGDTVSFTGADHNPFANGAISSIDESRPPYKFFMVDYSKASTNGRDPANGDLAITVPLR
jgi:hypothetical protein